MTTMSTQELIEDQEIMIVLNARNYRYYCDMVNQIEKGECPFCVIDPEKNNVIIDGKYWRAWSCPPEFMAKHLKYHFVMTPKKHVTKLNQLSKDDEKSLFDLIFRFTDEYNIEGGAIVMRFGDANKNAQSVRHLHCNLIVPDGTGDVKQTIAKSSEKIEQKKLVVACWEKMRLWEPGYHGKDTTDRFIAGTCLTPEEFKLVEKYFNE